MNVQRETIGPTPSTSGAQVAVACQSSGAAARFIGPSVLNNIRARHNHIKIELSNC